MVVYNLLCKKKHSFEGWFPSFEDFQKQAEKKLISCPTCGTTKVEKMPHACAVHVKKEQAPAPAKTSHKLLLLRRRRRRTSSRKCSSACITTSKKILRTWVLVLPKKRNRFTKARPKSARSTAPRPSEEAKEMADEGVPFVALPKPELDS